MTVNDDDRAPVGDHDLVGFGQRHTLEIVVAAAGYVDLARHGALLPDDLAGQQPRGKALAVRVQLVADLERDQVLGDLDGALARRDGLRLRLGQRHEVHVGDRPVALVAVLRGDPHQRRHVVDRAGVDGVDHRHVGPVDLDQRERERVRERVLLDGSATHVHPTTVPPGPTSTNSAGAVAPVSGSYSSGGQKRAAADLVGDQLAVTQCGEERSHIGAGRAGVWVLERVDGVRWSRSRRK